MQSIDSEIGPSAPPYQQVDLKIARRFTAMHISQPGAQASLLLARSSASLGQTLFRSKNRFSFGFERAARC